MSMKHVLVAATAVLLMSWVIPSTAQDSGAKGEVAKGELVRVDTSAKTIAIRPEQGSDSMVFAYTDATKVTGAGESVAGLATMSGSLVTVHFTKQQQGNVATQIDVQKRS
jgi:hypothetical protein